MGTVKSRLHAARAAIDATVQQLGRNNELPAILLPLFFGQGRAPWTQKLFGCLRPLTIGAAACLMVPWVPSALAEPDVPIVPAPDSVQIASTPAPGQEALDYTASLGADAVEVDPTDSNPMPVRGGKGATAPKGFTGKVTSKAQRRGSPSESDRRALEMMQLEEVQSAYLAADIERAEKELHEFDERYPKPYLSNERDALAARIGQAKTARVRAP